MNKYKYLTFEDRKKIEKLYSEGLRPGYSAEYRKGIAA